MKQIKFVLLGLFISVAAQAQNNADKAPVAPKVEAVQFKKKLAKLNLPLNSTSILGDAWPKALGPLNDHLEKSYAAACGEIGYGAISGGFEVPIHTSKIPELDRTSTLSDASIFKAARCSRPKIQKNKSGFTQAKGAIQLTLAEPSAGFEPADRKLYKISMPWKKTSGWGTGASDAKLYRQACSVDKKQGRSTIFVSCSEPEMSVACCGNAGLQGQMTALVYAYADHSLKEVTHTAESPLELLAMNSQYLASKAKALGDELAFSICTPANWEYSPVMAYQSTCYTLEHKFAVAEQAKHYCQGETATEKFWVLVETDSEAKKDYVDVTVQSDRLMASSGDYITETKDANGALILKTEAGAVLTIKGKSATLAEPNKILKQAPAEPFALTCK